MLSLFKAFPWPLALATITAKTDSSHRRLTTVEKSHLFNGTLAWKPSCSVWMCGILCLFRAKNVLHQFDIDQKDRILTGVSFLFRKENQSVVLLHQWLDLMAASCQYALLPVTYILWTICLHCMYTGPLSNNPQVKYSHIYTCSCESQWRIIRFADKIKDSHWFRTGGYRPVSSCSVVFFCILLSWTNQKHGILYPLHHKTAPILWHLDLNLDLDPILWTFRSRFFCNNTTQTDLCLFLSLSLKLSLNKN